MINSSEVLTSYVPGSAVMLSVVMSVALILKNLNRERFIPEGKII